MPPGQGLDTRALLRPGLRLHDHAADERARAAGPTLRGAAAGGADARRDLVDVRRVRLADQCRRGRPAARRRLLLLGGMASYLVLALAIPHAFSGTGTAFGLAYLAVVVVHATLFSRASSESVVRAILRLAPFNLSAAVLVLVAGIAGGTARVRHPGRPSSLLQWLVAAARLRPRLRHRARALRRAARPRGADRDRRIRRGRRHGRARALHRPGARRGRRARSRLAACLWWAYFGGDDERAEQALQGGVRPRRARSWR